MLKLRILFIITSYFFSVNLQSQSNNTDSLLVERYKRHITSLDYISRKTDNNKYFLNLANTYTDSILEIDTSNYFAKDFKNKISLTLLTCEENMNHKVELFPFFQGIPNYMGFADDPIEYAYDEAINKLLSVSALSFVLDETNITKSILIRDKCDDEMFEIVNQTLIKKANHSILPFYKIEELLGKSDAKKLINGQLNKSTISLLCKKLKIDRIGIFKVNDIDLINDSIWLVSSSFRTFTNSEGFSDTISKKGFSVDKRNISFFSILLHILESILLISLISFFDQRKKLIKIYREKKTSIIKSFLELFINQIQFITTCFLIPFVMSFVMIYSISILIPSAEDHFMEASSILWIVLLTIVMSIIPTLLNLLFINRLDLDGFHSEKGYRYFFNTSMYASYFPIFIFYTIQFNYIPRIKHMLLVIITLVIAGLLARSYYQFTAKSIHKNLRNQSLFGLILGTLALVFFNTLILSEINIQNLFYGFLIVVPISFIHYIIGKRLDILNEKKLKESENITLIKDIFISKVINPIEMIYDKITNGMSEDKLNIMTLSAPMGIGKTASLKKVKSEFEKAGWNWYYGDCDEIQGEGAVSFEPFIEAFSQLLKISEFSNRHEGIEAQKSIITSAVSLVGVNTDFIADFDRNEQKSMTEICIDIIDKLESLDKKTVFVMEDLHWIDPESYSFLKHFIDIINNNKFLRGNLCIILTLRDGLNTNYRGVAHQVLIDDLEAINDDSENKFLIEKLLSTKDFNLYDFVKHLSDQNNKFKIQSYSMNQINTIFNEELNQNNDVAVLTPLYILKVIEGWIDDGTLKYSPDGYLLTKTIDKNNLPNSTEVDGYYHSTLELFEPKWQRLLESAAIIGVKFDAEILAKVWGYELLEILAFLEKAVKHELLVDLSKEDNLYEFTDKRIISAIRSFFSVSDDEISDKQIVIEYNKRYIATQKDVILNPSLYSVEDLLKVARRLSSLISSNEYKNKLYGLIIEISMRFIISQDFDKLAAFSKFLLAKGMENISVILNILSMVSDRDTPKDNCIHQIKKIYPCHEIKPNETIIKANDDFEKELILITCLYFEKHIHHDIIKNQDISFLNAIVKNKYKEHVLFYLGFNLIFFRLENKGSINYHDIFLRLDTLLNSLKNSKDYNFYKNIIEIEKLNFKTESLFSKNTSWSDKYLRPSLDDVKNEYILLYNQLIELNDLKLLNRFLKYYTRFLTYTLSQQTHAIDLHLKSIILFEKNSNYLRAEIDFKMWIIRLCGDLFVSKHKKIAKENFDTIESFFQKRFKESTYNNFVDRYLDYKIEYLTATKDYIRLEKINKFVLNRYKKHEGEESNKYAIACSDYADALNFNGDIKGHIKWTEKSISIKENLRKKTGSILGLKPLYHNLVFKLIQFMPKNYKKILLYSKTALDFADPQVLNYWMSLKGYGIALAHTGNFLESYKYFQKSLDFLQSIEYENKEKLISNIKLNLALVYAKINLKKSLQMLKDAILEAKNPEFLLIHEVKESGKFQNWELISFAEKILKDNNA